MAGFSDVSRFGENPPMPAFARSNPSKPSVQSCGAMGTGVSDEEREKQRKKDEDDRRKAAKAARNRF